VSDLTLHLLICLGTLTGAGLVSMVLVLRAEQLLGGAQQERSREASAELDEAWRRLRRLRRHWRRGARGRAVREALYLVYRSYRDWKRLTLVGRIDLAMVSGIAAISVAVLGTDCWAVLRWLLERGPGLWR
jgi:hypothetical protein